MLRDVKLLLRGTGLPEALSTLYADDPVRLLAALAEREEELPEGDRKKTLVDLKEDTLGPESLPGAVQGS